MEITVVGRNIAVTDALRSYAEKKVAKLQKVLREGDTHRPGHHGG